MKRHRWTGRAELWASPDRSKVLLRETRDCAEMLDMQSLRGWTYVAFKIPWSFDFFNASKYLQDKGWTLVERL